MLSSAKSKHVTEWIVKKKIIKHSYLKNKIIDYVTDPDREYPKKAWKDLS